MSHADTLERRICPVCKRFPAGYAADSDVCLICGADTVPVSQANLGQSGAEPPRPVPRVEQPAERHDDVFLPFKTHEPLRKPIWPYVLGVIGVALILTVYLRREGSEPVLQPEIETQRGYDSGAVVAPSSPANVAAGPSVPSPAPVKIKPAESVTAEAAKPAAPAPSTLQATTAARNAEPAAAPQQEPPKDALTASETNILNGVRFALKQRDLTDARDRFSRLRQGAQSRAEVRQVSEDLVRRERDRDASLQRALICEFGKDWACMAQNAARAKDLDAGNVRAQVMLSTATSQLRWSNSTRPSTPLGPTATAP